MAQGMPPPLKRLPIAVRAVCLDMDGVITDTMPMHARAWLTVLRRHGRRLDRRTIYLHEGQKGMAFLKEIFGPCVSEQTLRQWLAEKEAFFKMHARPQLIPGIVGLLRRLDNDGIKLALVTGTSREETERLLPDHLRRFFAVVVTGDDVREGKPSPQPYRSAFSKLRVSPNEVVVIENAPFGIAAAVHAGARTIGLATTLPRKYLGTADLIVRDPAELMKRVRFVRLADQPRPRRRIVLVTKSSTYERMRRKIDRWSNADRGLTAILARFKEAHRQHYSTLRSVEESLAVRHLRYERMHRRRLKVVSDADLIVSVGGDGTVLTCAAVSSQIPILGVNSAPPTSVGRFCATDARRFPYWLDAWAYGGLKPMKLMRLKINWTSASHDRSDTVYALNDVLVADENPAAMSHYVIEVAALSEEQKSSGLWIATPAGSTGAMASAGGRILCFKQKAVQYQPRELYAPYGGCLLTGGVVSHRTRIRIVSLMNNGRIYWDGPHQARPFCFGDQIVVDGTAPPSLIFLPQTPDPRQRTFIPTNRADARTIGLLIVSHGSRSRDLPIELQRLGRCLKAIYPDFLIQPAYLELQQPDIPQGFKRLVQKGADLIIVLMNFLNAGKHTDEDVPRLLKTLQNSHRHVRIIVTPPLGRTRYWPVVFHRLIDEVLSSC